MQIDSPLAPLTHNASRRVRNRVYDAIRQSVTPMTRAALIEATQLSETSVDRALAALKREAKIHVDATGSRNGVLYTTPQSVPVPVKSTPTLPVHALRLEYQRIMEAMAELDARRAELAERIVEAVVRDDIA